MATRSVPLAICQLMGIMQTIAHLNLYQAGKIDLQAMNYEEDLRVRASHYSYEINDNQFKVVSHTKWEKAQKSFG